MKTRVIIGSIVLVSVCSSCASGPTIRQESDVSQTIFRYAELGPPGRIILGEPLDLQGDYGIREADRITRIPMSYPGTAWMRVYTDARGEVGALYFCYNAAFDFEKALSNYTTDLGPPATKQEGRDEIHAWQDDQTRFELVRRTGEKGPQHFSLLRDVKGSPATLLPDLTKAGTEAIALTVADVLATTEVWSILAVQSSHLLDVITARRPDLPPDTLAAVRTAIEEHFAPLSLYDRVRRHMEDHSDESLVAPLTDWLFDDTTIRLDALVDTYEPERTLEAYAASLNESRPPQERIDLLIRFARANHVGVFYIGLDAAQREAANTILASLPGPSEPLPAPPGEDVDEMANNYALGALVSFLWRFEPLTDAQIARTVESYETAWGQWYVQAYTEALTAALTAAGHDVAQQMSGLP